MYYLQSRYYDPNTGRFINADALISTGQGLLGYNMYSYCVNNPVMYWDDTGKYPIWQTGPSAKESVCLGPDAGSALYYEELLVLNGFSDNYKGAKVYRNALPGGNGFSCGMIFLGKDIGTEFDDVMLLRHEYGHYCQLQESGMIEYSIFVLIPSMSTALLSKLKIITVNYYSTPWEFIADCMGGVKGREYQPDVLEWAYIYNQAIKAYREFKDFISSE